MKGQYFKILFFLFVVGGSLFSELDEAWPQGSKKKILSLQMYVPSPVASYQKLSTSILQLTPLESKDAGNCQGVPELEGSLYFSKKDKQIYICDSNLGWIAGSDLWVKKEKIRRETVNSIYPLDIEEDTSNYKIGVGTMTPEFQLSLEGDGSFIAVHHPKKFPPDPDGMPVLKSGRDLATSGEEGSKLIWWPKKGAFRAGYVKGDQWDSKVNSENIGPYSVAMGLDTIASGKASIAAGGWKNEALGEYQPTISGGRDNKITWGEWTTISGGSENNGYGSGRNTVSGGKKNSTYFAPLWQVFHAYYSTISGGLENYIYDPYMAGYCTVSGGQKNVLRDPYDSYDVISGGGNNQIYFPSGGRCNTIAGGQSCKILDDYSSFNNTIGGGSNNIQEEADVSTILGGYFNNFVGDFLTILGGYQNKIEDYTSSESGLPVDYATVVGGYQNFAYGGDYAVVLGGENNRTEQSSGYSNSAHVTIHGGNQNRENGSKYVTILGGKNNETERDYSVAAGYGVENGQGFVWSVDGADATRSYDGDLLIDAPKAGIGVTDPTAVLHVNGNIKADLRKLSSAGGPVSPLIYDQTTQEIGYDVAELFETTEKVERGDVLVLDEKEKFKLKRAAMPYDKKVIGIVSQSPAILFKGSQLEIAPSPGGFVKGLKPPVALSGRVLCKVTTENGSIEAGDFLTTSSRPGYAMKATDKEKFFGTVLGKALEPFRRGKTGLILVLVTLQ